MSLEQLFDSVAKARETAHWRAAFGEPQAIEDKTVIPVARVWYGFGLGFGSGNGPAGEGDKPTPGGEGGGGGGGATANPLGVIVVTPERVYFQQTLDKTKIILAAIAVGTAFVMQASKTLRVIFRRH